MIYIGEGDTILNNIRWYTLISFADYLDYDLVHKYFGNRYHVTEELLQSIMTDICVDGGDITDFIRSLCSKYCNYARNHWLDIHDANDLDIVKLGKECNAFWNRQTFRLGLKEYFLGYLAEANEAFDNTLHKWVQIDLNADAAVSTYKHLFAKNKSYFISFHMIVVSC